MHERGCRVGKQWILGRIRQVVSEQSQRGPQKIVVQRENARKLAEYIEEGLTYRRSSL